MPCGLNKYKTVQIAQCELDMFLIHCLFLWGSANLLMFRSSRAENCQGCKLPSYILWWQQGVLSIASYNKKCVPKQTHSWIHKDLNPTTPPGLSSPCSVGIESSSPSNTHTHTLLSSPISHRLPWDVRVITVKQLKRGLDSECDERLSRGCRMLQVEFTPAEPRHWTSVFKCALIIRGFSSPCVTYRQVMCSNTAWSIWVLPVCLM